MAAQSTCVACSSTDTLKKCGRCKAVSYCSPQCQKTDWKSHKMTCRSSADPLSLLLAIPDLETTPQSPISTTNTGITVLNVPELRMAVFSLLSAPTLLKVQQICRSWYLTIALESTLQQRLFFGAGPGELILPAMKGL